MPVNILISLLNILQSNCVLLKLFLFNFFSYTSIISCSGAVVWLSLPIISWSVNLVLSSVLTSKLLLIALSSSILCMCWSHPRCIFSITVSTSLIFYSSQLYTSDSITTLLHTSGFISFFLYKVLACARNLQPSMILCYSAAITNVFVVLSVFFTFLLE